MSLWLVTLWWLHALSKSTESSILRELKKIEVSSYKLLWVLHMVCICKKSCCLAQIGNQNWNQRKCGRTTGRTSTCKFLLLHCEIYFMFDPFINTDTLPHPVLLLLYPQQFTGIPSVDYLKAGKEFMHYYHACCHMRYIIWVFRQNILSWRQKWNVYSLKEVTSENRSTAAESCSFQAGFSSVVGDKELIILYGLYESVFTLLTESFCNYGNSYKGGYLLTYLKQNKTKQNQTPVLHYFCKYIW